MLNVVCVVEGDAPLFIQGVEMVLGAILGMRTKLHHLCMEACHHLSKER